MKIDFIGDSFFKNETEGVSENRYDTNLELMVKFSTYFGNNKTQQKYVLRKSILSCSMGTQLSSLDIPNDHAVSPIVALISDSVVLANIHTFGKCKCQKNIDGYPICSPFLISKWQQHNTSSTQIWNEITQMYESIVKKNALMTCFYGGIITISEIPNCNSLVTAAMLICIHQNKIAIIDMMHPKAESILKESIPMISIVDEEMALAQDSQFTARLLSTYGAELSAYGDSVQAGSEGIKDAKETREEIDLVDQKDKAVNKAFDKIDEGRSDGYLPAGNEMTELAEEYLRAGGDKAGVTIGLVWVFGLSPEGSVEELKRLRELGVIGEQEKMGVISINGDGQWVQDLLMAIPAFNGSWDVDWESYMRANPILRGKVGDVVVPIGQCLKDGESKKVTMEISMIIENGSGFTGYEFLHGTDETVGGFQISGTISKSKKGDVIYKMVYKWNDIINPEIERYIDDAKRAKTADEYFSPKDYIIRIKWSDTTKIKVNPGFLNNNSGWLKDWNSNWSNELSARYSDLFKTSENEQVKTLGAPSWTDRLQQIKEKYADYYN